MGTLATLVPTTLASAVCVGDCDGDGAVTIAELVTAVRMALDGTDADRCASIDVNHDGQVTVDELIQAVNAALGGCPSAPARLIALSRSGRIAALDLTDRWMVRRTGDLGATIASARCQDGQCVVVHPAPVDAISIVDVATLSVQRIALEHGADPRDVALVGDHIAVVSQYGRAALLEVNLATRSVVPIDVSELADDDGLPEVLRLASCGRRVFAQLRRVDHGSDAPAPIGAALAVIDLDRPAGDQLVDAAPNVPGIQGIALAGRPNFDMPVDCGAATLYVAEPVPVLQGGGGYERVDLTTLTADVWPIATGAEVGGFEVVEPDRYWLITHTDFGPGASSHLALVGGTSADTYNTFAEEHVNDLALDREDDLLFFPDPCMPRPANESCDTGVVVFQAHTGVRASAKSIDVGFPPIEVVVAR